MSGWSKYAIRKPGTNKVVAVQFRTGTDPNPGLFHPGHVYTARVTGVSSLISQDGANESAFAGTIVANEAPYAKQVIVLNRTTIKVVFSEPVKNVNEPYFVMKEQGGDAVGISHDELNNTGAVVTEVTLKLSKDMMPGRVYYLTFNPGITDAAGFNGWKTKNGNEDMKLLFTGVRSSKERNTSGGASSERLQETSIGRAAKPVPDEAPPKRSTPKAEMQG